MPRFASICALFIVLLCVACTNSAAECGACCDTASCSEQSSAHTDTHLLGRADIDAAGARVGTLRTLKGDGAGATTVTNVFNVRGELVGFVTADGSAFRGLGLQRVRVGQSADIRELAALILSTPAGQRVSLSSVHGTLIPGFPGHR